MTIINGIECQTTFWNDFSIADMFGKEAIEETYQAAFSTWSENVSYAKELVLVLNHKIGQYYGSNDDYMQLYKRIWNDAHNKCLDYYGQPEKKMS